MRSPEIPHRLGWLAARPQAERHGRLHRRGGGPRRGDAGGGPPGTSVPLPAWRASGSP